MGEFYYSCTDNGGKKQLFKVKACSKLEAIKKGRAKAEKKAAGDINIWDCKLIRVL